MAKTDDRVPVTVLTGFLGSGKTTLLNHILRSPDHGLRFAIIENEFGEVGVDDKLIPTSSEAGAEGAIQHLNEEVIEVMNGCICCTVRGDLVEALKRLHQKVEKFDAVLIETTGMADPAPVAQTFFVDEEVQKKFRLDGIVTVVDAMHLVQHLDEEKPEGAENESNEQLAFADVVILNKCDLLEAPPGETVAAAEDCGDATAAMTVTHSGPSGDEEAAKLSAEEKLARIEARIKGINGGVPIHRAKFSQVDPKVLLNIGGFNLDKVLEMDPEFLQPESAEHVHDDTISSVAWSLPGLELNVNKLNRWISTLLKELGQDLFRYKGVLAVKGKDEKFVFQGVHMLFSGGFKQEMKWQPGEARECRFVFIGKYMKQTHGERLLKEFQNCQAEESLRFALGDAVEARCGCGWEKAKVIKLWDEGNPYRLELQNEKKTNVWGPVDDDMFVRKPAA